MPLKFSPDQLSNRILLTARSRGCDARDVRDAAHEGSHALELRLTNWDRKSISTAVDKLTRADQFRSEILARAVEANICALCEFPYDQDFFLSIAHLEAAKCSNIIFPPNFKDMVEQARQGAEVWDIVRRLRTLRIRKTP